ncbi:MAG: GTPase Era [Butyrivibrio sp.]|jgi:GTP-binding protein Era|nr:GTPase Era [Butyrivibrio sp.]
MTNPDNFKTGFITLIGRPNVGKSTLMNQMIGMKIAITSSKPQTTRNRIQTVYTDEQSQMIFLDTPGIHESKNKLGEYMVKVAQSTLDEVDVILWLVEPSTFIGQGEQEIIKKLKKSKKPVILVINKIDTVDKEKLSTFIERYQKEMDFAEIICTSALKRENIDGLMDAIRKYLPYGPAYYDEDTITDQPERDIVAEIIREKALRLLKDEVPHGIAVTTESMKERQREKDGEIIMDIEATIICERDSHKGIIIGKNGAMLRKIGSQARIDIEKLIECKANLQLWVKVRRDWRDDMGQMRALGYDARKNK